MPSFILKNKYYTQSTHNHLQKSKNNIEALNIYYPKSNIQYLV